MFISKRETILNRNQLLELIYPLTFLSKPDTMNPNLKITSRANPGDLTYPASLVNIPSMKTTLTIMDSNTKVLALLNLFHQIQTEKDFVRLLKNELKETMSTPAIRVFGFLKTLFNAGYTVNNQSGDTHYLVTIPSSMYAALKLSVTRNGKSIYEGSVHGYKMFGDVVHSNKLDLTAWYDVESSMAKRLGYNPAREICTVEFVGGNTAEYEMTESAFKDFVTSDSVGVYYNRNVKGKE